MNLVRKHEEALDSVCLLG